MTFKNSDKERALLYLDKLFEAGKIVRIDPVIEAKSLNQNRYLWLILTHAAFETGSDKNYLYFIFLKRFPILHEVKNITGELELVPVTLSQFSKEETTVFIDNVARELRSTGIEVVDPEDKKAIEMFNYYHSRGLI